MTLVTLTKSGNIVCEKELAYLGHSFVRCLEYRTGLFNEFYEPTEIAPDFTHLRAEFHHLERLDPLPRNFNPHRLPK